MSGNTPVLHTLTAYTFMDGFPHASHPVSWDLVKDEVYEATVTFNRPPAVYMCPDREGNGMTVIAYRHFADPDRFSGAHVYWTHRDVRLRGCTDTTCCA